MRRVGFSLMVLGALVSWSCGGGSEDLRVSVVTATGFENVKADLSNTYNNNPAYRGLYVVIREMNDCPCTLEDYSPSGINVSSPTTSTRGIDPAQKSISIDTTGLPLGKFYHISLQVRDATNVQTHIALPDCWAYLDEPKLNAPINLCFGGNDVALADCLGRVKASTDSCLGPVRCANACN